MMAITIDKAERTVEWTTAAPLLSTFLQNEQIQQVRKPALLRFKTDSFMHDLVQLLQTDPRQLAGLIARPESFRAPPTGEPSMVSSISSQPALSVTCPVYPIVL